MIRIIAAAIVLVFTSVRASAQRYEADSWQEVQVRKAGTVTALWDDIEPFIYTSPEGQLQGVEYEIMESFRPWLKMKYGVDLTVKWQRAGSFDSIYYKVRTSKQPGVFGWSYYSITAEREAEVDFTPAYMPDVNVLITNNREPMYASAQEFTGRLPEMTAYIQPYTTMEEDVNKIKDAFFRKLRFSTVDNDYDIMRNVAMNERSFGYVPLSIYIVGLQKGIKVKRQSVLSNRRQGFAGVMPQGSDWKPVIDEYFTSEFFRAKAGAIVARYLGSQVKDLVFDRHGASVDDDSTNGMDLVSLEKEIVTRRLMDTAMEAQSQRSYRNFILVVLGFAIILLALLYSRYRVKQRLNNKLREHNRRIVSQNARIEQMNQLLNLKIIQSRMNPHFLFNSLNSIQYFIMGNDKVATMTYINKFSSFLRKVINFGDAIEIELKNEAELVTEYLWLEHSRFSNKFDYTVKMKDGLAAQILPMISLSLVEEAIYGRVLNLPDGTRGNIEVCFSANEDRLSVTVTDNGITAADPVSEEERRIQSADSNVLDKRIELFNLQAGQKIVRKTSGSTANGQILNSTTLDIPQPLFNHLKS